MPSPRKVTRDVGRQRGKPTTPQKGSEPKNSKSSRSTMEQGAETNGCEDGSVSAAVSNHNDVAQSAPSNKVMAKSFSPQDTKKSRQAATPAANNKSRGRKPATSPPNNAVSRRRETRNVQAPTPVAQQPSVTAPIVAVKSTPNRVPTAAERKAMKPLPQVKKQPITLTLKKESPTAASVKEQVPASATAARSSRHSQSGPVVAPIKQPRKRKAEPVTIDLEGPASRASKRIRLQHQPFQSPPPLNLFTTILRQTMAKTPDDKIMVFNKGEFLAVRNENGSFFVCRTAQNVYKCSKRFKIQWMSDKEPDLYIPDFYDQTDFECVLTNLRMKRIDKNKYQLPGEERQRTLNILQRALNVENGIDISAFKVSTDGVDVSIVGKEEEESMMKLAKEKIKSEIKVKTSPVLKQRGRPKRPDTATKISPAAITGERKMSRTLAAKVKLRAQRTVKVKLKKEGAKLIISNKVGKSAKVRKISERLHPNSKVTVFEKNPTFEMNIPIPYVSSSAHSKLLIRAILLKDIKMLQDLIKDTQKICSLNSFRSVDLHKTPLAYAVLEEDHRALRALLTAKQKKYANPPETLLEQQQTGHFNMLMLGHAVKPISVSRGGKEGNNAFLKDASHCHSTYPYVDTELLKMALKAGVSKDTFELLFAEDKENAYAYTFNKDEVLKRIHIAIRFGHQKLAAQLVSEAVDKGGYGFNNLHKEVLANDRQPLTAFKSVSVLKKAQGNARITPMHCAAINSNPEYLSALITSVPEYNIPDDNGWRPIHYASACKSTGPLELLISRGVSLDEPESDGNTALQVAAFAGRAHNVDLILRSLAATENNRKETAITVSLQDKQCVNAIDKGNKISYTALHIACQEGHSDVVRVLIRHKANVDKLTNAQHDKLTPLMLASQQGHLDVVNLLIENSAQVEMKDKRQRTALTHAVINGQDHITSYLLRLGANPNSTDSSGNTLVHYAAAYGWYFCLKLLIEAGASLNLPNDWKITPLSLAFMKGHMGLVDFLVEQPGIDINVDVNNDSGMTLVMQALRSKINHSMLERIHFLVVKQKSDCTKVDFMGNNAFHHLVASEVSEVQLETKMDVCEEYLEETEDTQDGRSKTKLDENLVFKEEAQQEHDALLQEITKLLLDHSCDPMVVNKEGESPFNLAVKEGCLLLVKMFLDSGCQLNLFVSQSGDNILHYLVAHARNRKVEPMLQAILNAKCSSADTTPHQLLCQMAKMYNNNGHTPLLQALHTLVNCKDEESQNRLLNFAKFLLDELGADVAVPCKDKNDKETSYALHLAIKSKGSRAVEVLLAHKPPLNAYDDKGHTPLILAIKEENTEAVEALVKAGANVNLKSTDKETMSPLIFASKNAKLGSIIQLLVASKADVYDVDIKNKNTALHYVLSNRALNVLETAKALLTAGSDVNALNNQKRTPLHLSINASESDSDSSYAVEECVIGFGAKLDALDVRHRTPLHYAFTKIGKPFDDSQIDPMELVVLLTGAMQVETINIPDQFGQTVLHCAAYRGATISVMHISKSFKDLDSKDKNGNTALGLSVKNGHESCALMLLQRGAKCIADIITVPQTNTESWNEKKETPGRMEWVHVKKPPLVPERHSILQETLLKDWQGILYLMLDQLDSTGKGINLAVEASLRTAKYNVALKLIGRVKHGWTLYNDKQSMLHVLTREASPDYLPEIQIKVAQFLIEKGVPALALDEHSSTVLQYAAINRNHTLFFFFANKIGLQLAVKSNPDKSGRTPFSALFWKLTSEDMSEDVRNWICNLIKAGSDPNVLTSYPIKTSTYPGVRCTVLDSLHIENPESPKYSPLMMAIYKGNYSVAKLLLNKGADVNFPDDKARTPLMHAIRLNDIKMIKLLLNFNYDPFKDEDPYCETEPGSFQKTSAVDLSAKDSNGWTIVHYIVDPLPDYCYANTFLVNFLAELGAPLDVANNANETPLQMAARLKCVVLVDALQKLLNTPEDQKTKIELISPVTPSDDVVWDQPISSFDEDSKFYLEKLESEKIDVDKKHIPQPDPLSGLKNNGEIVMDTEKDIPYDLVMTVVDLNYGAYGIYNFYKMQLIKHIGKDLFILFTCWGRVGDTGQHQKTPFSSLPEAVKEFTRIFRAKSGNHWDDVKNFQPQPKKYRLVSLEKSKPHSDAPVQLNLKSDVPSKLSKDKQELMDNFMNVHTLEDTLQRLGVHMKFEVLPFGSLSNETLLEAESILTQIGSVIAEKDNLTQNVKSQEKYAELMHKIVKLSEEFYQLLPVYGYQYEKLCPLFSGPDVHSKLQLLDNLLHIGLSSQLLLGASLKSSEINPKDYVYRSLNCILTPLNSESQEAQMILQYAHNTSCYSAPHIHSIYSVHLPKQEELFNPRKLSNRMLLWHGTRLSNLLSVIHRGLQVAPLGVQMQGDLFGKGIYFADMFRKSQSFCVQQKSAKTKCILLCEVALGEMKEVYPNADENVASDSVKAAGRQQPDPAKSVFWHGMTVPLGDPVNILERSPKTQHHFLNFNEYVVYDASQVCIRYLIQFSD